MIWEYHLKVCLLKNVKQLELNLMSVRTFLKNLYKGLLIFQVMTKMIIFQDFSTFKTPFLKWKHTEFKISNF